MAKELDKLRFLYSWEHLASYLQTRKTFAKKCRSAEQRGGASEAWLFSLNCYVHSWDSTQKAYCCHVRCMRGKGGLKHSHYNYFNLPFLLLSISCSLPCYTTIHIQQLYVNWWLKLILSWKGQIPTANPSFLNWTAKWGLLTQPLLSG